MVAVLLVIHLLLAIALIGVVLIQRSEGGGLGIGGGGGGLGGFMTARGTANLLTRTTAILAGAFMVTSLILSLVSSSPRERQSIMDNISPAAPSPAVPTAPGSPVPTPPSAPQGAPAANPPAAEQPAEPAPPIAR
jgi:preprotein translocase subunit SecG